MLKMRVVGPVEAEVGESSRPRERARDKGKGKEREMPSLGWEEVVGRSEADRA